MATSSGIVHMRSLLNKAKRRSEINCEIIKNDSNKINKNKKDEKNISGQ